jgi:uncharacterized integral membrane protein
MEGGSVRIWDWLAGAAGLALAIGIFMPFYLENEETWTGWKSFMLIDKLALLTGVLAIALPIRAALKPTDHSIQWHVLLVALLSLLTLIFVLYRMANAADVTTIVPDPKSTLEPGAYVCLVASIVLFLASALGARARLARRAAQRA